MDKLEIQWARVCNDAGFGPDISCSPNRSRLQVYYAAVDRIAMEREAPLRSAIAAERKNASGDTIYYIAGIEAALNRAIATPRVV